MLIFKKEFNLKTIRLFIALIFMFEADFAYSYDVHVDKALRVPCQMANGDTKKRIQESLYKITRRYFLKVMAGSILSFGLSAVFKGDASAGSIISLLKDVEENVKKPYLGEEYFIYGNHVFDTNGKRLGWNDSYSPKKIIDPGTGDVIGWYNWDKGPDDKKYIYDRAGVSTLVEVTKDKDNNFKKIYIKTKNNKLREIGSFYKDIDDKEYIMDNRTGYPLLIEPCRLVYLSNESGKPVWYVNAADSKSLSYYYFTSEPSERLYSELKKAVESFNTRELSGMLLKIELTRRLIEIGIQLGYLQDIVMDKNEIKDAYNRFKAASLIKLNDFKDSDTQDILWKVISSVHPKFRLYYEAVKTLGLENDPQILERTIGEVKEGFVLVLSDMYKEAVTSVEPQVNNIVRDMLGACLLYYSSGTDSDVSTFNEKYCKEEVANSEISIETPMSILSDIGASNGTTQKTSLSLAHNTAIALKRAGFETRLVLGYDIVVKDKIKTPHYEWFVIYKDSKGWWNADLFYKKAVKVEKGLHIFKDIDYLKKNMGFKDIYIINADNFSYIPYSVKEYLNIEDKMIFPKGDYGEPDNKISYFSSFRSNVFYQASDRSPAEINKAIDMKNTIMFDAIIKKYGIKFRFDRLVTSEIAKRKSSFTKAVQSLPEKFISKLQEVEFHKKILYQGSEAVGVNENGDIVYKETTEAAGTYNDAQGILRQADIREDTTVHELAHAWEDSVEDDIRDTYYNISWNGTGTARNNDPDLFAQLYGLTNYREDFATMLEEYVSNGSSLRNRIRILMKKGKFELAIKYLFMKYVVCEDFDGVCFEYDILNDDSARPLDIYEVSNNMKSHNGVLPANLITSFEGIIKLAKDGDVYDRLNKSVRNQIEGLGLSNAVIESVFSKAVLRYEKGRVKGNLLILKLIARLENTTVGNVLRRSLFHERLHDILNLYKIDLSPLMDNYEKIKAEFSEEFGRFDKEEEFMEELIVKYYTYKFSGQDRELFESDLFIGVGAVVEKIMPKDLHRLFITDTFVEKNNQIVKLNELRDELRRLGGKLNIVFDENPEFSKFTQEIESLLKSSIGTYNVKSPYSLSIRTGI